MKNVITLLALAALLIGGSLPVISQEKPPAARTSPKASVTQRIGISTDVTFDYSRPAVKGRKIWGGLVPLGLTPGNKSSKDKPFPWRGGANENTTIAFTSPVSIDGTTLAAGKYGMHFIPSDSTWIVIFSKTNSAWGSYTYDQKDDALRITVTPVKAAFQEWLEYGFDELTATSAVAFLHWEELKLPFKITVEK